MRYTRGKMRHRLWKRHSRRKRPRPTPSTTQVVVRPPPEKEDPDDADILYSPIETIHFGYGECNRVRRFKQRLQPGYRYELTVHEKYSTCSRWVTALISEKQAPKSMVEQGTIVANDEGTRFSVPVSSLLSVLKDDNSSELIVRLRRKLKAKAK